MYLIEQTKRFQVYSGGNGQRIEIVRRDDNASIFLQDDDASEFQQDYQDALNALATSLPSSVRLINIVCDQYFD